MGEGEEEERRETYKSKEAKTNENNERESGIEETKEINEAIMRK
jgi:hypothetical protein